ncbi:ABC transporter ATP-binding protein [Microlunatus sp. GCM10028923]|uniref:ABC transporter ATP-binding protein n=1 Tax=Microlunatus sp. GCM10028923 TaxID=3273400 RepID=UPI00361BA7A6
MAEPLLEVRDLTIGTGTGEDRITPVEQVSFDLAAGETLCIVGESGSGKSLTLLAVLGLLPTPLTVLSGSIRYRGRELIGLSDRELRPLRGKDISMVFQDPMTALNPVKRVGSELRRAILAHRPGLGRAEADLQVRELLDEVGIANPGVRARSYPHQWSGGMRQRAVIGMAMANNPSVLLADEPTTALDVTVQAQVIDVLARRREATGAAMIMITHDLGLVAQVADRIAVMYAGRIVEQGTVWDLFDDPRHPYSAGLLASLLTRQRIGRRAYAIPGAPPAPSARPAGCPFAPRCEHPARSERCSADVPTLVELTATRSVACWPEGASR